MFRLFRPGDEEEFYAMAAIFHGSDIVVHDTQKWHFEKTFKGIVDGTRPFSEGYVFEVDGQIAGYGLVFINYSNEYDGKIYTWDEIYVKPEFRNRGIGTDYIHFLEEKHKDDAGCYRLEVEEWNTGAVSLYERLGYKRARYRQMFQFMNLASPRPEHDNIRPFRPGDEEIYYELSEKYFNGGYTETVAPRKHFENSFKRIMDGDPFLQGYFIECEGKPVGYAIIAPTYANEVCSAKNAGLIFVDELYILPEYRGRGLSNDFLDYYENLYRDEDGAYRVQFTDGDEVVKNRFERRGWEMLEYYEMHKPVRH